MKAVAFVLIRWRWFGLVAAVAFVLMWFGLSVAVAESIVVVNSTTSALTNLELMFDNGTGPHSIRKIVKLSPRANQEISVTFKGIPPGDGTYTLTFNYEGGRYAMRFGYGPTGSRTKVLIGQHFDIMKPGQTVPAGVRMSNQDLVLVTLVD